SNRTTFGVVPAINADFWIAYTCAPLKPGVLGSIGYSFVEMYSPFASIPTSGWSPKHGQPACVCSPLRPSFVTSTLKKFQSDGLVDGVPVLLVAIWNVPGASNAPVEGSRPNMRIVMKK